MLVTFLFIFTPLTHAKVAKIGFSKKDHKASLHLIQLLRDQKLSQKDLNDLRALINLSQPKQSAFHKYHNQFSSLANVKRKFPSSCKRVSINTLQSDLVEKRIQRIIDYECEELFLTKFLKIKRPNRKQIDDILPILLSSKYNHRDHIVRVTRKISKTAYQELVQNYIIQNELKDFPRSVVKHLPKTSLLESYLQTIGFHDHNKKASYHRTLKRFSRNFRKAMRRKRLKKAKKIAKDAINFYMVNSESFDNSKAWSIFRSMGRSLAHNNLYDEAIELFKLSSLIGNRSEYSESVFYIVWTYLLQDRYDKAYKFIFEERLETQLTTLDDRLKFWIAKVFLENGFKIRARQIFKGLINPKSLSYYSIIAKKELSEIDRAESEKILASLYQSQTNKLDPVSFTEKEVKALRRYKVFKSIQATHYAYDQLTTLTNSIDFIANPDALKPQADFYYSLIQFLNQEDDFLTSFKIMMSALNKEYFVLDENLLTMLFPNDYIKTIQRHAAKTNPIVFLSLIRQESAFNPSAKSRVGARGLMQIMPRTARQFQRRIRASSLNRPSVNLKIGIKYFEKLNKKYDGNLIHILSAYNAGEGRVKRWKRNIFKSDDPLLNIESIPFNETQNYVKLIYRNIFFYQYLNDSEKILSDIDDSFKIQHYAKSI